MIPLEAFLGLATALAFVAWRLRRASVVVQDHELGVLCRDGRFVRVLEGGRHWRLVPGLTVQLVDRRPTLAVVSGQEVPTRDGASVRVSAVASYRVVDARAWLEGSSQPAAELYSTLQIALREAIAELELESVLTERAAPNERLRAALAPLAQRLGLEVHSVALKDVAASGDLKRALADELRARAEGRAKLERARAETAALRNLVNAARLVRENVGLYELRLLETASHAAERPGNSLLLGLTRELLEPRSAEGAR